MKYYLKKKTKRSNFTEDENANKSKKTAIKLISLNDSKYNLNDYSYIKFSFGDEIKLSELIKNKSQLVKLNIDSDKIYVVDKIELRNEKGDHRQTFLLPIYIKKCNSCYISLKHKKKGYSFEFIFYSKNKKIIDTYKLGPYKPGQANKQELDIFDKYDLKYRKKINFINVEKKIANDYLKNLPLNKNSYKICSRIKQNDNILTSVHKLNVDKKIISEKSELKANLNDIKKIYNFFNEFKKKKKLESLKKKYKSLNNENVFAKFINEYIYAKKYYSNISEITENDVNILKEYLLKLILQFFFIDFSEEKNSIDPNKKNNMLTNIIDNFTSLIEDIENFTQNLDNPILYKFRLFRSTLFNVHSIIIKNSNKLISLETISFYKQKIMSLKNLSDDNPFNKAIKFMKEIARNLNEDSCLFDLLLQYNSGISDDLDLLRRKRKKYKNNNTKYELSMITVKELAEHLEKIIPDFIIRYTSDDETYAFYSSLNDLVFFNDKKTFKSYMMADYNGNDNLILPIVLLLIHECWGHRKVALSNSKIKKSPIRNYLINEDFEEDEYFIINKSTGKLKGESGYEIEYLITGKKYDNIFSNYLLDCNANNNRNLLNVELWNQPNFEEFQKIMESNYKEENKCDFDGLLRKNRDNKNYEIPYKYDEGTIIEDGIEIELFKA